MSLRHDLYVLSEMQIKSLFSYSSYLYFSIPPLQSQCLSGRVWNSSNRKHFGFVFSLLVTTKMNILRHLLGFFFLFITVLEFVCNLLIMCVLFQKHSNKAQKTKKKIKTSDKFLQKRCEHPAAAAARFRARLSFEEQQDHNKPKSEQQQVRGGARAFYLRGQEGGKNILEGL